MPIAVEPGGSRPDGPSASTDATSSMSPRRTISSARRAILACSTGSRHREHNVPRVESYRPRAPPAASARAGTGEQRHLDRARGPLASAAPKPGVEPAGPAHQLERLEPRGPGIEPPAARGVERRLAEQPLGQRADVESGAADDHRHPAVRLAPSAIQPVGVAREMPRAVPRARIDQVEAVVRDPGPLLPASAWRCRCRAADRPAASRPR